MFWFEFIFCGVGVVSGGWGDVSFGVLFGVGVLFWRVVCFGGMCDFGVVALFGVRDFGVVALFVGVFLEGRVVSDRFGSVGDGDMASLLEGVRICGFVFCGRSKFSF